MIQLTPETLPALYRSADRLSAESQNTYFRLIFLEYSLLIVCALMSMKPVEEGWYFTLYTVLFVLALSSFIYRYVNKPEQVWYQARALAESIKTLAWKFSMRAAPFDEGSVAKAHSEFAERIQKVLSANTFAGSKLPAEWGDKPQVTPQMLSLREKKLTERREIYAEQRIQNQRSWYAKKSGFNKRCANYWSAACICTYLLAVISSMIRIDNPTWSFLPTEPLIVVAAAFLGWIQIKKFNELASSYILTAHEIGLLHQKINSSSEEAFSRFVNDSEQAFSREHTQWVARFNA